MTLRSINDMNGTLPGESDYELYKRFNELSLEDKWEIVCDNLSHDDLCDEGMDYLMTNSEFIYKMIGRHKLDEKYVKQMKEE